MKKILISLGLVLGLVTSVVAQPSHKSYSFLNPAYSSITYSNLTGITNALTAVYVGSNAPGLYWTNNSGRQTVATNTGLGTWANTAFPVLQDVPLWSTRNGLVAWEPNTNYLNIPLSGATLSVTLKGGSGANTASTLVFTPLFDGVHESTVATDVWTVGVLPNTTTMTTTTTNVPLWKWPGAKALRLVRITSGETDASSQVTLFNLSINGYVPVGP